MTVRLVGRRDSEQPEPFFLGPGAEWATVELMVRSVIICRSAGSLVSELSPTVNPVSIFFGIFCLKNVEIGYCDLCHDVDHLILLQTTHKSTACSCYLGFWICFEGTPFLW